MNACKTLALALVTALFLGCLASVSALAADAPAKTDAPAAGAPKKAATPDAGAKATAPAKKAAKDKAVYPLPKDPRPYAASPYAENIDKALNYLIHDQSWGRWMNLALLDLLQRKFGLHERYGIADSFAPDKRADADLSVIKTFGRLTDPNHRFNPAELPTTLNLNPIFLMMVHSMYCDATPLPPAFFLSLTAELDKSVKTAPPTNDSEYGITHCALVYAWLCENGCTDIAPGFAEFQEKVAGSMADMVKAGSLKRDVAYEAMALLFFMGAGAKVEKAWLDEVAAAQQPDGGWAYDQAAEGAVSDGHPTVLALWALLESAMPEAPKTPMIQKGAEKDADKPADKPAEKAAEKAPEKQ